ncbi:MAG: Rne/Rng family ribonuclease [Clostridioides sp.]|nr:Rne/Rng family ribonuclease [Clostridioides sp.]
MKKIIIETLVTSQKTAVLDGDGNQDSLEELFIDESSSDNIISNIYRGVVKNTVGGLDACFVDIGIERFGYLKLSDDQSVKAGDEIMVQVNKGEVGNKGAKLNLEVSLSGRYFVYIPSNTRVVVSGKLKDKAEISRLKSETKNIISELGFQRLGLIIRTEAKNTEYDELKIDLEKLILKYSEIEKEYKLGIGSKLLYKTESSALKYITEHINEEVSTIKVDDEETYEDIKGKLKKIDRAYLDKLTFEKNENLFGLYRVDEKLRKIFAKKVWLKSGGYIIIDKTEAMTVIDVNSGKFTKGTSMEETSYKTNLEAAKEIANQLKLRDIGGIVVIDFIDMRKSKNKVGVISELEMALSLERRKSEVLGFTRLGLVEITRRREKSRIDEFYFSDCENCGAENGVYSIEYMIDEIEKSVRKIVNHTVYRDISIDLNSTVRNEIMENYYIYIEKIQQKYEVRLSLAENLSMTHNSIKVNRSK